MLRNWKLNLHAVTKFYLNKCGRAISFFKHDWLNFSLTLKTYGKVIYNKQSNYEFKKSHYHKRL